jgi:hypothetical protein
MGDFRVTVNVTEAGPLLNGTAPEVIRVWMDDVKQDIAQAGVNNLRGFVMDKTGRATGHYQSQIVTSTLMPFNDVRIHDPVVYGPWLEGTSERNRSTRFKGYRLWRKTAQRLQDDAPKIAEAKLPDLANRLGGSG